MMATMKNDFTKAFEKLAVVAIIPTAKKTNRIKTARTRMIRQSLMRAVGCNSDQISVLPREVSHTYMAAVQQYHHFQKRHFQASSRSVS
jgi:hypothetical protein